MNLKRIFFAVSIIGLSLTSCGSLRTSDCGLSKSLKIENIHEVKEPKIMLVDSQKNYKNTTISENN